MSCCTEQELEQAFQNYWRTGAVEERWHDWSQLFTEDVDYIEHQLGGMRGRDAVRGWIVPLMSEHGALYTVYCWHTLDLQRGRVVFAMINRRDHPNGSDTIDFDGLSVIDYAGDGLWKRQEDYWAMPAGRAAFTAYQEACAKFDQAHPGRRTRGDWGAGPAWTIGHPVGPAGASA
jgi:hypothetical protein